MTFLLPSRRSFALGLALLALVASRQIREKRLTRRTDPPGYPQPLVADG
jgi:hypothetical protein